MMSRKTILAVIIVLGVGAAAVFGYQTFIGGHYSHTTNGHGDHHGADGTGHDEINMPGLRGLDATVEESAEMERMFKDFQNITRSVTLLPNGIETITYSDDPELMKTVVSHVVGMIARVEEGRDPKVIIQSPTLDILFERRDTIQTQIETTDAGIVVIQTSDDPEVVTALQTHAAEVTDMVNRGMESVHERMMGSGH